MLFLAIITAGCSEKDMMQETLSANNFKGLIAQINKACQSLDTQTCNYVKGTIILTLPNAFDTDYEPVGEDAVKAKELYKDLNNKNVKEFIQIYKGMLLKNLESVRKRDTEITKNLDNLYAAYLRTKHYAEDIILSDITINFENKRGAMLSFTLTNKTQKIIKQAVAEVEFYSVSDIFLGRIKAFSHTFTPDLKPGGKAVIKTTLESIPGNDLVLIRAAKGLKTKVSVSSLQISSKIEDENSLILNLPYSYHRMRQLISDSEKLYNDTVNKINAIH